MNVLLRRVGWHMGISPFLGSISQAVPTLHVYLLGLSLAGMPDGTQPHFLLLVKFKSLPNAGLAFLGF